MGREKEENQGTQFQHIWEVAHIVMLTSHGPAFRKRLERAGSEAGSSHGPTESDGSREDRMDVGGQLVSAKKIKRFPALSVAWKMLSDLAPNRRLLSTVLGPSQFSGAEQRLCRHCSHKSQTTGFNLQGG